MSHMNLAYCLIVECFIKTVYQYLHCSLNKNWVALVCPYFSIHSSIFGYSCNFICENYSQKLFNSFFQNFVKNFVLPIT